jgi:hypothetical protein
MIRAAAILLVAMAAGAQTSDIRRDEEIVFFPAAAFQVDAAWELEIRGCVYEPENRRVSMALLREALGFQGVKLNEAETAIFKERARLFMADHERRKQVVVRAGDRVVTLGRTQANGHFSGTVRLSEADVRQLQSGAPAPAGRVHFHAVLPKRDTRIFAGEAILFAQTGFIIVSDIDDTIKVTDVHDRKAILRNTFLRPFEPVPGMAALYDTWARDSGAEFCYVSASPWQLFAPLSEFVHSNGFPAGTFLLKDFRVKDRSFLNLFADPEQYKLGLIEPLLGRFPARRFVLVGDSGERDPEIYAAVARRHPSRVAHIFIRDVTGEAPDSERYQKAFEGLPPDLWRVFRQPAEIETVFR